MRPGIVGDPAGTRCTRRLVHVPSHAFIRRAFFFCGTEYPARDIIGPGHGATTRPRCHETAADGVRVPHAVGLPMVRPETCRVGRRRDRDGRAMGCHGGGRPRPLRHHIRRVGPHRVSRPDHRAHCGGQGPCRADGMRPAGGTGRSRRTKGDQARGEGSGSTDMLSAAPQRPVRGGFVPPPWNMVMPTAPDTVRIRFGVGAGIRAQNTRTALRPDTGATGNPVFRSSGKIRAKDVPTTAHDPRRRA